MLYQVCAAPSAVRMETPSVSAMAKVWGVQGIRRNSFATNVGLWRRAEWLCISSAPVV